MDTDVELIFVDDGSADKTLEEMKKLHEIDTRCRYLSFSRNFGKEAAIYAGLTHAEGDYIAVMDVDLQDPPSLFPSTRASPLPIRRAGRYVPPTESAGRPRLQAACCKKRNWSGSGDKNRRQAVRT